jgi:hypothetical protein
MKTNELTGAALDWAVAKCEVGDAAEQAGDWWKPSTNWAQGGPIIEREGMTLSCGLNKSYAMKSVGYLVHEYGATPLIAAMRCYVASKLGDDVEIPKELL